MLCLGKKALCPQECDKMLHSMEEGMQHFEECAKTPVRCKLCNAEVPREALEGHLNECPRAKVTCE